MTYKLGAIGLGHWVKRLQQVLQIERKMALCNAVALRPYDDRKDELEFYKIPREKYFNILAGNKIPDGFFNGLDAVQIASHNKYHFDQAIQCLEKGKISIVEKTLAINHEEFKSIIDYIRKNSHDRNVLLHLHYLTKALTFELSEMLPHLIDEHGRIIKFEATFFEKFNEEDSRRTWLFSPEHGGVFMDWVHPLTILIHILGADINKTENTTTYIVRPEYDNINPSAVFVNYRISGENFSKDSSADVRVGKGFDIDSEKKFIRLHFENSKFIDLEYLNTEEEFLTGRRGCWKLCSLRDGKIRLLDYKEVIGKLSYEILIDEVISMVQGGYPHLGVNDIVKIFEPEWEFQKISSETRPVKDETEIQKLIEKGLAIKNLY